MTKMAFPQRAKSYQPFPQGVKPDDSQALRSELIKSSDPLKGRVFSQTVKSRALELRESSRLFLVKF